MKMQSRSERLNFMKIGLDIDSWRGWESTGIALVGETAKAAPVVYKRAVNGRDFIQLHSVEKYLNDIEKYPVVIGHNRAATTGRGNIVDHNAHPFQYGKITLVHNGHIRNTYDLKGAAQKADCQVDSAHVACAMDQNGEMDTLESVDGGFCFVWWNSELETLNIARNNERPMHMAYAAKENTMYFASEFTALLHLMKDIEIDEDSGIMFPKPMVWYKFSLKDLREYSKTPFAKSQGRQSSRGNTRTIGQHGPLSLQAPETSTSKLDLTDEELSELESLATSKDTNQNETSELDEIRQELSKERQKDAKQHGVPTSPKRLQRATAELKKLGIRYREMRACIPKTWVKYKNQEGLGTVVAEIRKTGQLVEVLNIRWDQFEMAWRYKVILVDCVNTRIGSKDDVRVVGVLSDKMDRFIERRKQQLEEKEKLARENHRNSVSNSIDRIVPGPNGNRISMARFYELSQDGCANCCQDIYPKDIDDLVWVGDAPVCLNCSTSPGILDLLGSSQIAKMGTH